MHCRLLWHPCSWSLPLDARSTLSPSYHSQDCLHPDIAKQHLEKKSLWLKTADIHMSQSTCMVLNGESDTVQFSSVAQSCPALCDPIDCSTPGFPVHHQLLKFTQTHVHRVGDAIQPSHPLLSLSPPAFNLSHHQGLFK